MDIHEMNDRIEDEKKKRAKPGSREDNAGIAQNALTAMNKMAGMSEGTMFAKAFVMPSEIEPGRKWEEPYTGSVAKMMSKFGISEQDARELLDEHIAIAQDIFSGAAQDYGNQTPKLYGENNSRIRRFQPAAKPRTKDR